MAWVAFVGLGTMGRPLAGRLVAAGHDLVGRDAGAGLGDQDYSARYLAPRAQS